MNTYASGPFTLNERLFSLGIRTILIINRHNFDTAAAQAASRSLTWPEFGFYDAGNALAVIQRLDPERARHTLIITDLNIEDPTLGLRIIELAMWRKALAFAAAAGPHSIRLMPCFDSTNNTFVGKKSDPELWNKMFQAFYLQAALKDGFVRNVVNVWKTAGVIDSVVIGETLRLIREEIAVMQPRARVPIPSLSAR